MFVYIVWDIDRIVAVKRTEETAKKLCDENKEYGYDYEEVEVEE